MTCHAGTQSTEALPMSEQAQLSDVEPTTAEAVGEIDPFIPLVDLAKLVPGRPSTNCLWRWCRKGVKSRNGDKVRLQHVRIGGKIYTKVAWLEDFGSKLAGADSRYFDLRDASGRAARQGQKPRRSSSSRFEQERRRAIESAEQELAEAGI